MKASRNKICRELAAGRDGVQTSRWHRAMVAGGTSTSDGDLPNVTICAVVLNAEKWLDGFLRSIDVLNYPKSKISLYFIDNGSSDSSKKILNAFEGKRAAEYRQVQLFDHDNLGYGTSNDFGICRSDDEYVLVTNVDVELFPESLRNAANIAMHDDADVASWEFRQTPYEHPKYYDPVTLLTHWSAHACVLIRKSAYLDVGGYEKRIFMYGEDVELSYRFRREGWKLRYVPTALVTHHVDLSDRTNRPLQLSGSVAANILLRYRYGGLRDILLGEAMLWKTKRREAKQEWIDASAKVRESRWHFLSTRRWFSKAKFSFSGFEYGLRRLGAHYENSPSDKTPLVSVVSLNSDANTVATINNQTYGNIEHITTPDVAPRGKYICWLDPETLLFADHIEVLVAALENNKKAGYAYGFTHFEHEERDDSGAQYTNAILFRKTSMKDQTVVPTRDTKIENVLKTSTAVTVPKTLLVLADY